ncbi:uncharacterized protein LOC108090821 [Drosophila ficusphila]|uniref:uncharacterized protein LOC108090821 n=1 Tax=Drosophila ficusphila TaxID=30025 RepID=UPI0007E6D4B0|nr:uncharacterized protein LOC108090821 [Drosophila ficusphila]
MVVLIAVIVLIGLCPVQAVINRDTYTPLIALVVTHLNGSQSDFDNWTKEISLTVEIEQQERVSWNIPWLQTLESGKSSLNLQQKLNPSNFFKLKLWLSFYWYLKRSLLLNEILLSNFALELRKLHKNQSELWDNDIQNMLQSLPRPLRLLVRSHRLCLQHKKEMLYATADNQLELGANSNCSIWEVEPEIHDHWLRLVNVCDEKDHFFISMLSQEESHILHRAPNKFARQFCVLKGLGYFEEASRTLNMKSRCNWQLNDCRFLPMIISVNNRN